MNLTSGFTVKDQSLTYLRAAADCNYGTRYWYKCSRCTEKSTTSDYQVGSALGHDYSGPAATCSTPQICARSGCNVQLKQALGCDYSGPPATCISSQNCTRCNAVLVSRVGTHMNTYYTYSVLNCAYASLAPYHFKHTMCRDCGAEVEKVTENHYDNYIPPRGSRVCEACNRSWSTGVMN